MTTEKQARDVSQRMWKINKHAATASPRTGTRSSCAETYRFLSRTKLHNNLDEFVLGYGRFLLVAVGGFTYLRQAGYHRSPGVQEGPARSLLLRQDEYSIILLHKPTTPAPKWHFCYFHSSIASMQNHSEHRTPCDSVHSALFEC